VSSRNKGRSRNAYDFLVGTATGGRRQALFRVIGDVRADDGEVTGVEFEDVGAAARASGRFAAFVRIGTDSSQYFHCSIMLFECLIPAKLIFQYGLHQFGLTCFGCQAAWMNYSLRYGRFRALLRKIREEAGISQTELARKLGKPQTFVSKSEIGERRLDFLETVDFCAACRMPVGEFAARLEKSAPAQQGEKRQKRRSPRKMDSEGRLTE